MIVININTLSLRALDDLKEVKSKPEKCFQGDDIALIFRHTYLDLIDKDLNAK